MWILLLSEQHLPPQYFNKKKHNTLNNNKIKLEICAHTLTSALIAQEGGADRIELCAAIEVGGITPSPNTILEARRLLHIDICVLVRPRSGDFCYSDLEFEVLKKDILFCKEQGINGVVVGVLKPNQELDIERMTELLKLARPMQVACHRAFDRTPDGLKTMEQLISIGYDRILTSGQKDSVSEGKNYLKTLVEAAKGRIAIMPGNGVTVENMADILTTTGVKDIHATAKNLVIGKQDDSGGLFGFNMKNALANNYYETDLELVKQMIVTIGKI
jgi:copper homeostasis protein